MASIDKISNINFERIQWCCAESNISIEDLALAVKMSLKNLTEVKLSFTQLSKIADYFGYGVLFFLNPEEPQDKNIHSVAFRTLANQKIPFDVKLKKLVERVEFQRDAYLNLLEEMGEPYQWQAPKLTGSSIKEKATQVRQWLGIDNLEKYDFAAYRELLEAKGVLVFRSIGYNGKWKVHHENLVGFSIMHQSVPTIFIRKTTLERQTFTLFHELGHLLLHGESCIDDEENLLSNQHTDRERQANKFAGHCLLNDAFFEGNWWADVSAENSYQRFSDRAKKLGVSVEVIVVALLQKSLITQTDYETYKTNSDQEFQKKEQKHKNKNAGNRGYRHREPRHILGDTYVKTIFNSLHDDKITLNKASDLLDRLKIADLKKLGEFYA